MELSVEKRKNYQKNLRCLQDVTEELLSHMKGHDFSFRAEITDGKGAFRPEKLQSLVEEMLSLWSQDLRLGTDVDPDTGESLAEPYLRERRELYGLYLYLVMRCSLYPGAYADARGGTGATQARTDFAFLLEQAKALSQSWCVTAGPDGTRKNELSMGFDPHFGFHLYHPFNLYSTFLNLDTESADFALTPDWDTVWGRLDCLTNEGNHKRIQIRHLSPLRRRPEQTEETPEEDAWDDADSPDWEDYDAAEDSWNDYDAMEDDWDLIRAYDADEAAYLAEKDNRTYNLLALAQRFECLGEYLSACRRFQALFEAAKPEVLRGFCGELEEIVDLYLAQREAAPLSDTDKTLDVYHRICDGPCRQAKRYARGLKWDDR